ncbi:hypothetical protein [Vibrio lentus]|uniref:hypothetical protein n=1 Tax=Vibrio lentus TaxID=136468 RepID=UPI00178C8E7B|nr:hypothetical protein [Vibrio lentus]MDN3632895.1 hypothetical protein [Vibrio lentus]
MSTKGYCKLCRCFGLLENSHAIGDSIFKKITRKSSGKGITFTSDASEPVHYTQDSWAEHQLCRSCEKLMNNRYEGYGLKVLRGKTKPKISESGVSFNSIDQGRLAKYFLSIIWRAYHSSHPAYDHIAMLPSDSEYIRFALLDDTKIPNNKFSIRVSRVMDLSSTPSFSRESIKDLIVSPFSRDYSNPSNVSVCLLFEGFFIEIFYKSLPLQQRNRLGVLSNSSENLFVPFENIFEIKEVADLMFLGFVKHKQGQSTVS